MMTRFLVNLLVLCILLVVPVNAQVTTADLTGRVVDAQGNAVAGATVTAKNTGTALVRTSTTNDSGDYTITQLPPGNYEVSVEAQGFSKALQKNFELNVGTKPTLNFDMKAGGVTEVVEVQGGAQLIETTKSEIGGVVTPVEVQNLPLLKDLRSAFGDHARSAPGR